MIFEDGRIEAHFVQYPGGVLTFIPHFESAIGAAGTYQNGTVDGLGLAAK